MIIVSDLKGNVINNYPTVLAAAYACEGMTSDELWRYSFLDKDRMRYISWSEIENLVRKVENKYLTQPG